ncbi:50S ribosomal protein L30e-like protein [Microdochium trichocladiopsis]|uniref:H/ACA ribonucleoprotein complex subunit 2 n=1 Tax=Microdochium trichocladiopsis TaxID=1682393 RepID=A0A9P9BML9_9PEZI|nr:50S ribosomal protein L30e-like protein [Microdochium trichocladiopsis]KAH7026006.1 50S ribosomal protein L30e-like protein [Microdochium trichocladiopsis]
MGATKPEKKEKKDKASKRAEVDGVTKPKDKKDKKEKKEKKEKLKSAVNAALDDQLQADAAANVDEVSEDKVLAAAPPAVGALVPFALPLADDKATKKILKTVRKAAKSKTLKRGVKEVVKSLRKSPAAGPNNTAFPGVVVLAGDISPMDVISHIPVLCEDVNVPYIFVSSRAELGAAGSTKRPTSVVMVTEKRTGGKAASASATIAEEDGEEDFAEVYKDLVKLVQKESKQLKFA